MNQEMINVIESAFEKSNSDSLDIFLKENYLKLKNEFRISEYRMISHILELCKDRKIDSSYFEEVMYKIEQEELNYYVGG